MELQKWGEFARCYDIVIGLQVVHHGEPDSTFEVQVLIPQPFMGTIIGTGGTKIKELRTVRHFFVWICMCVFSVCASP